MTAIQKLQEKRPLVSPTSGAVTTGQSRTNSQRIFCDICGQGPMDQKSHLEDHKEAQHSDSEKSREQSAVIATENKVSKAELLDGDYEIHWDDDDSGEEGLDLQDPDGGVDPEVRERKLRARWQPILEQLRERGRVVIGQDSHLGQLRGGNIVESFKRDVKRMSLEFDVNIDYRGHDHDTVITIQD